MQIDLIVRGACILPVNDTDKNGNIRVRSVIGRFLEHTRVFYFRSPSIDELWLSSADFMSRNMLRRIELAWPLEDQNLKNRILEEGLGVYLKDTENAWQLESDGRYRSLSEGDSLSAKNLNKRIAFDAHKELMTRYGANNITKLPAP